MKIQTIYQIGQKPNQEDSLFPLEGEAKSNGRIFMICDGMGGHENGEVASSIVAATVGKLTTASGAITIEQMRRAFDNALAMAYDELDKADTADSIKKMGTTLTFAAWCEDGVLVAHIGDSRVYQFRPGQGILFQTRDHSLVNDLIASGDLTPEEARTFNQRNVITRAIQPHQEYRAKAAFNVIRDVRKGDIFMLCSDGIVEQIENPELIAILLADKPLVDKCNDLREECAQRETRDNHSCYLIEVDEDIMVAKNVAVASPVGGNTQNVTPTLAPSAPKTKSIFDNKILLILLAAVLVMVGVLFVMSKFSSSQPQDESENGNSPVDSALIYDDQERNEVEEKADQYNQGRSNSGSQGVIVPPTQKESVASGKPAVKQTNKAEQKKSETTKSNNDGKTSEPAAPSENQTSSSTSNSFSPKGFINNTTRKNAPQTQQSQQEKPQQTPSQAPQSKENNSSNTVNL